MAIIINHPGAILAIEVKQIGDRPDERVGAVGRIADRSRVEIGGQRQAVALAEFDGLVDPNAYGKLPLIDKDPTKPAINPGANPADPAEYDYWDHVDYIVDEANGDGLYVALLPTWASWVVKNPSRDESIFTAASAHWAATAAPWASRTSGAPWRRVRRLR